MRFIDMTGQRFGRLIVARLSPKKTARGLLRWLCRCDCGKYTITQGAHLRSGHTTSCGCYGAERRVAGSLIHGHTRFKQHTTEFIRYVHMTQRCYNPKNPAFPRYGGRGITICDRWLYSFANFFEDMGKCPRGLTLDRIDNNGPYSPENCRWASLSEQQRNTSVNSWVEYEGVRMLQVDFVKISSVSQQTASKYIKKGWTGDQIAEHIIEWRSRHPGRGRSIE